MSPKLDHLVGLTAQGDHHAAAGDEQRLRSDHGNDRQPAVEQRADPSLGCEGQWRRVSTSS
jgi:hypothetical protein